jgi:hypothetical protein
MGKNLSLHSVDLRMERSDGLKELFPKGATILFPFRMALFS